MHEAEAWHRCIYIYTSKQQDKKDKKDKITDSSVLSQLYHVLLTTVLNMSRPKNLQKTSLSVVV